MFILNGGRHKRNPKRVDVDHLTLEVPWSLLLEKWYKEKVDRRCKTTVEGKLWREFASLEWTRGLNRILGVYEVQFLNILGTSFTRNAACKVASTFLFLRARFYSVHSGPEGRVAGKKCTKIFQDVHQKVTLEESIPTEWVPRRPQGALRLRLPPSLGLSLSGAFVSIFSLILPHSCAGITTWLPAVTVY